MTEFHEVTFGADRRFRPCFGRSSGSANQIADYPCTPFYQPRTVPPGQAAWLSCLSRSSGGVLPGRSDRSCRPGSRRRPEPHHRWRRERETFPATARCGNEDPEHFSQRLAGRVARRLDRLMAIDGLEKKLLEALLQFGHLGRGRDDQRGPSDVGDRRDAARRQLPARPRTSKSLTCQLINSWTIARRNCGSSSDANRRRTRSAASRHKRHGEQFVESSKPSSSASSASCES